MRKTRFYLPGLVFLLFLVPAALLAQNITIAGRVVDGGSGNPLEFASVTLEVEADSQLVAGVIADPDGYFSMVGDFSGEYQLKVSYLGYIIHEEPLLIGELNNIYQMGNISLFPSTSELDEVTVTASAGITSAGLERTTFNMDDMLAQSGGSVLDALRGLPGVTVSQEGIVILRGSDRVAILIDGKQSSLTGFGNQKGLENIPVSSIEKIEIINNPSARYDASGMAGIINLIYRKEEASGFHGDLGFTYGLGNLIERKTDLPTQLGSYRGNSKYIPALNLSYKKQDFRLFLQSEVIRQAALPNNEFTTRYYDDGTRTASQVPENRKQTHYIINGGADWYINNQDQLTISAIYDYESHIDTAQVPYIDLLDMHRMRYWTWKEFEITGYMNYMVQYLHRFREPGHELTASFQYTKGWEDESYYLNDSSSIRQSVDSTHILATEHTILGTADYIRPLRHGRFEAGVKTQIRRLPVTYTVAEGTASIIYPGLGDWSDWGEDLYGGYMNYVREMPRYDIEAGLRAEFTRVFYDLATENIYYEENDSYNYFRLFPNVRVTLKVDERHRISLFYNHRVDRPGEPELRVFPKYDDPELLKVGNPYLRPQFTQSFEMAFRKVWETGSIFLSGYHKVIDDYFTRIYSVDSTSGVYDIINKIYQNVGRATNSGTELILTQGVGDHVKLSGSVNSYRIKWGPHTGEMLFPYRREFIIDETIDLTWDTKLSGQFTFPWNLDLQLSWIYYAPRTIPQGEQLARSSVDIGIRKSMFQDKGELSLTVSDLMNRFGIRQEIKGNIFHARYDNLYETQVFRLGYKHKF